MAHSTDEDLAQLEKDVRQFKIEYEQYFGGGKSRPPADTEWRIETMIKRYSDRGASRMSFPQRFRYNNLTQAYVKYREIFRKRLKQKEQGESPRHYGSAAKKIEAERARKKAAQESLTLAKEFPFSVSCKDPDHEKKKVEQLFSAFRRARAHVGEAGERFSIATFQDFVREKTDQLKKQRGAHEVEYVVTIEGKQARLKARVKS
jgi:hypothetical protein